MYSKYIIVLTLNMAGGGWFAMSMIILLYLYNMFCAII